MEPILVKRATDTGWTVRFNTTFQSFSRDESPSAPVLSTVTDDLTQQSYIIKSKYLFGCDGARSRTMKQLSIPFHKGGGEGLAFNVLTKVELGDHMRWRSGNLHWIIQPEKDVPAWSLFCIARMIRPWDE